ncbi:MAG: hypothetical protein QM652_09435 [Legionella sp.]|uniref:hypothetical protein n=1 Tax=Legionella sp. TaxID=459 RepID=UPI0039E2E843
MSLELIKTLHKEQMKSFYATKNNFFVPYETKKDFAIGCVKPFVSSAMLYFSMNKFSAYLLAAAAVGAVIYTAKALVESVKGDLTSANKSFSNSSLLLKTTLAFAVLTLLNPILDSLSLLTRSATTLKDAVLGNSEVAAAKHN